MAIITVYLKKQWYSGGQAIVLIDGKRMGRVQRGTSESYEVTPGTHKLRILLSQWPVTPEIFDKFRFLGDVDIDFSLAGNEEVKYECNLTGINLFFNLIFPILVIAVVFLKHVFEIVYYSSDHFLIFLLVIYLILVLIRGKFIKTRETGRHDIKSSSE
jgi:hypothetical protein